MKSLVLLLCAVCAAVNASVIKSATIVGPPSEPVVIQGPSAKATVNGPDGSRIDAYAPGGTVIAEPKSAGAITASVEDGAIGHLAHAPPVVAIHAAPPAAIVPILHSVAAAPVPEVSPGVAQASSAAEAAAEASAAVAQATAEAAAQATAEAAANAAAVASPSNVLVAGPSGVIETKGDSAIVAHSSDLASSSVPVAPAVAQDGSAATAALIESGEYVPDNFEKLYDDGSYRPEHEKSESCD